jgi:predicted RNA-binding Zn ribbon-like protein
MLAHRPPVLGEPLALEFANTRFAHRGHELEGLQAPEDLAGWLRRVRDRLPLVPPDRDLDAIGPAQLATARGVRDALRTLFAAATAGVALDPVAAETLNRTVRAAPQWHELSTQPQPAVAIHTAAPRVCAALAAIAEDGIRLLTGPDAVALRACAAPGCILYYRKNHPRRAWCSPRCSNRVRSARHYMRRGATSSDPIA